MSPDCATDHACRGSDRGGKSEEEAEVASCQQARNEESWYRRLKGVVQDGEAVVALDAINELPDSQKIDTLHINFVTGPIQDVIDLNGTAGVELDAQCASGLLTADDTRLGMNRDRLVTQTRS